MGEIADMMLDGTLCQGCGVYLDDGELGGYPRYCCSCERENEVAEIDRDVRKAVATQKVKCPTCGRKVKPAGIKDHQRDAHGVRS